MNKITAFTSSVLLALAFVVPASAKEAGCEYILPAGWGTYETIESKVTPKLLEKNVTYEGPAKIAICGKATLITLAGHKDTFGVVPEEIMSSQVAEAFRADLDMVITNFMVLKPTSLLAAGADGLVAGFKLLPESSDLENEIGLRLPDGIADSIFFKTESGETLFVQILEVQTAQFGKSVKPPLNLGPPIEKLF